MDVCIGIYINLHPLYLLRVNCTANCMSTSYWLNNNKNLITKKMSSTPDDYVIVFRV